VQGPGENAGVLDIGDNEVVVFKIESHNHPSFIEPFQGAATGVGGILRDVFTMGARPIALMNALRFGSPSNKRTKYLLSRAVAGIGTYGNCVGVPTVGGELFFDEAYDGNCLVNAFALGLADKDKIFLGRASGVGNILMYAGSKTGRDGIHGATMSSETFDENSEEKRPTVQVGDPFQEKLLIEACLAAMQSGLVLGIQDMGAAGMTSSSYEIADRGEVGLRIDLDRVPQREEGMNPYEIMLSESQERMLLVVERGNVEGVRKIFSHWGLDAAEIGEVTAGQTVDLYWNGKMISSLAPSVLTRSVPQYRWPEEPPADYEARLSFPVDSLSPPDDLAAFWLKFLSSENVCSRKGVYRQYDSTVRTNTVVHPGGDAAVIRIKRSGGSTLPEKGIAMTLDCNSRYCLVDPRQGTALSVAEAYRNICAVGAAPIGISDCLNFGSPQRRDSMWQIAEAIRGLGESARAFDIPVISGNVSLNNETKGKPVLPTPEIAMVGLMPDASKAVTIYFKEDGDRIFVIGVTNPADLGASEYLSVLSGLQKGSLPTLDYDIELRHGQAIRDLINAGLLRSCHDLSQGGLAAALAESCFGPDAQGSAKRRGARLWREKGASEEEMIAHAALFAETGGRYLVSVRAKDEKAFIEFVGERSIPIALSGVVGGPEIIVEGCARIALEEAYQRWAEGLHALLGN